MYRILQEEDPSLFLSALFLADCRHVEMVQRLEGRVLVHEDVTFEPPWKSFGELVFGVSSRGNGDWRRAYEYVAI